MQSICVINRYIYSQSHTRRWRLAVAEAPVIEKEHLRWHAAFAIGNERHLSLVGHARVAREGDFEFGRPHHKKTRSSSHLRCQFSPRFLSPVTLDQAGIEGFLSQG